MSLSIDVDELVKIYKKINDYRTLLIIGIILIPVIIGIPIFLFSYDRRRYYQKIKDKILIKIIVSVRESLENSQKIIKDIETSDTYLIYSKKTEAEARLNEYLTSLNKLYLNKQAFSEDLNQKIVDAINYMSKILVKVNNYNNEFVEKRLVIYNDLFNKSPFPLDENQKRAVIIDDKHNLVVAGAGSGKTEVLINRIAYLLERKPDTIKPERIVALAFQNKAASEMRDRLKKRYGLDVKIKTFHSFGNEILQRAYENPPQLMFQGDSDYEYNEYIKSLYTDELIHDTCFQNLILSYLSLADDVEKQEADFKEKNAYYEYLRQLTYTTLNGKTVKSDGERQIYNFFLTHTINGKRVRIIYESAAEWMSYLDEKGKNHTPKPDFFLPDFDLYIELWAIDEKGNVPEWFEGDNSSERYRWGMAKKRNRFYNQTKYQLIEINQWEIYKNEIDDLLKERLIRALKINFPDKKFEISQLKFEEIVSNVWHDCKDNLNSIPFNIAKFIRIAKTYDLEPDKIENRLITEKWSYKQKAFGNLALFAFKLYENRLRSSNRIDFTDMITLAVKAMENNPNLLENTFDHILIDEYQDISAQRYNLIKQLMLKNNDCKLFCVGDDWQSIMGFTGSNVDYFVNFHNYFGHPARTDLTINYRSTKPIVDLGSKIILQNEKVQLKKQTFAYTNEGKRAQVIEFCTDDTDYYDHMINHCIGTIADLLKSGYSQNDIMILTRIIKNYKITQKLEANSKFKISHEGRHNSIPFMSVHKSKGLQAKVVFILNVIDDMYGFPCKIEDARIFEPAILGRKKDNLEEERRLFYVAVTRAKEQVIIYTNTPLKSKFIQEITDYVDIQKL